MPLPAPQLDWSGDVARRSADGATGFVKIQPDRMIPTARVPVEIRDHLFSLCGHSPDATQIARMAGSSPRTNG